MLDGSKWLPIGESATMDELVEKDLEGLTVADGSVTILALTGWKIRNIPELAELKQLRRLDLKGCTSIQSKPTTPNQLLNAYQHTYERLAMAE